MLPAKIAFVDVETTGTRSNYDRIIEIGILRVENNELTGTFQTLLNPQTFLPKEIEGLTGIHSKDLENAPTFRQIKDELLEILDGCVFVAHNVRFDYGFLKSEFKRENISFSKKQFCTVRLSRLLYPTHPRHNLDALIDRFNFSCDNRHRAFDDAKVLFDFYKKIKEEIPSEILHDAVSKCMKKPSIPPKLSHTSLDNLPETPGVYIFYAESGMPLYVGKSINLRERILSHFTQDIHSSTEMNISQQIASIETIPTAGELGALLLESKLIKKLLPLYNKVARIKQELVALKCKTNSHEYKEVYMEPINILAPEQLGAGKIGQNEFLGFFRSKKQAKDHLGTLQKKYMLCDKLLGLEKTKTSCFSYNLGVCKGACVNAEKPALYNIRFITAFAANAIKPWPFKGAVVIEEKEFNGKSEYFLIDKWCYLGNVTVDGLDGKKDEMIDNVIFDLDTYKILKRYLNNPKNLKNIYPAGGMIKTMQNPFEKEKITQY